MSEDVLKKSSQDNYTTEKVNVISNCLLGNYINNEYVISDDIKSELTKVRKVKKSVYKNSVFCSAYIVGYGDVIFEVTFQKNSVKNIAMAELFVLEDEYKINGYIQNTVRTKISEFTGELENFIEKTYDHFAIVLTEDGGRDYNEKVDISMNAYIFAKKSFSMNMAKLTSKEYNKLYKNYVTARLEALKGVNNDYSKMILNKFNGEFSKIEKFFLKDNNYKALSELLDKCIEDCSGINPMLKQQEKECMDKLVPIVNDFSKQADEIYAKAQPKAMSGLNKNDKALMEDIEREMLENSKHLKEEKKESEKNLEKEKSSEKESSEEKKEKKKEDKKEKEKKQESKSSSSEKSAEKEPEKTTKIENNKENINYGGDKIKGNLEDVLGRYREISKSRTNDSKIAQEHPADNVKTEQEHTLDLSGPWM